MNLKNRSLACIACIISYVNMLLLIFCVLVSLGISCTCAFCSPWDPFASKGPVFISYHLLPGYNGKMLIYDNIRTPFRQAIASGTKQIINLSDNDNMIRIDLNEGQIELVTEYKKISK